MEIDPATCCDKLKRYWSRRRYQRILSTATANRRKLKIRRLGGVNQYRRIRLIPRLRLRLKIFSPMIKIFSKFHDAYVDTMIGLSSYVGKINKVGALGGGKRIAKSSQVLMVSSTCEEVDSKLVLEIYKRLVASRQMELME